MCIRDSPKPALGIGIEARNVNVIDEGVWEYSALYAGPSVFYSSGNYFLIFNIMPQLINLAGEERPLDLVHQEKFQFRTLAGIRF